MNSWKHRAALLLGTCSLLSVGCIAEPDSPQTEGDTAPVEQEAEPKAAKRHFKRGHGPAAMLIDTALEELSLTAGQRSTLEEVLEDLRPSKDGMKAHRELTAALAAGLRAGAVDEDLVAAKMKVVKEVGEDRNDKMADSLNTLHATLTPEQRTALVEIVRERGEKMRAHFEAKAKKKAEAHDDPGDASGPRGKRPHHGMGSWFARGVDMTDEQRDQLKTALADAGIEKPTREQMGARFAEMKKGMKAMFDAFATSEFDAKSHLGTVSSDMMEKGLEHYVTVMQALATILDEDQRAQLATRLEEGPKHMKHHRKHADQD